MLKKEILGKLLVTFGIATILASLVDYASLLLPLHLGNTHWVYSVVKSVSEISIIPLIGITAIIAGFYMIIPKENQIVIVFERIMSGACALFAIFLIVLTFLFTISLDSVGNRMVSQVKEQGEQLKQQITVFKEQNPEIDEKKVQQSIKRIDENLLIKVKSVNNKFLKANIKIFINLLAFMAAYIIFSLILFNTSIITRKKLLYENSQR